MASDWDVEGSGKNVHRSTWAAVGGASGLVLGFSIPVGGRAPGSSRSSPVPSRFVITSEQIREASLINAMEAVRFFHPEWLRQQRPDSFADITPDNIQVYLDNVRLERIEDLTQINAIDIESIRFHDTQQATVRWGTGHRFGAIQVLTRN